MKSPLDPSFLLLTDQYVLGVLPESSLRRSGAYFVAAPEVTS